MNRKELTKTVMMISNRKKYFDLQGFHKKNQRLKGYCAEIFLDKPRNQRVFSI